MSSEVGAVQISELVVKYGDHTVLNDLSLNLDVGVTALLGINGAGKTTLLHALCGLIQPDSGYVRIGGHDPHDRKSRREALRKIALVPQDLSFPRHVRARDFLTYMAFLREVPARVRAAEVERVAEAVNLRSKLTQRISQLSGGMQRRLLIAQALLGDADILVLDEPTSGLDPEQRATVRDLIKQASATKSVLLASHIVEDISYISDRLVVLHHGGIAFDGPMGSLNEQGDGDSEEMLGSALEHAFLALIRGAQ